ncbi:MAG: hypothetical protein D6816_15940 [Bacteroidetes bacterium]|nr:MAG: hypothetical protein D6816_15940 [Bacteroidota bacterium]
MRLIPLFLVLPLFSTAQNTLNFEQFLAIAQMDAALVQNPNALDVKFPWIDKYEFRSETNDFDWQRQEYTVRISPSIPGIRKAQKQYYEQLKQAPALEELGDRCEDFLELHDDWISLFTSYKKEEILDEWDSLLNKKLQIAQQMAEAFNLDPEKLLDIQSEISDLKLFRSKIKTERDFLIDKYQIGNYRLIFDDLISLDSIKGYLEKIAVQSQNSSPEIQALLQEQQMLESEMDLEKSEQRKVVDFLQLKYNGPNDDPWKERLSVGLGLQLSNSGSQKLKMQKLQIEQEELKRKTERKIQRQQEEIEWLKYKLERNIRVYREYYAVVEEEIEKQRAYGLKATQGKNYSPLYLLTAESKKLKSEMELLKMQEDIFKLYYLLMKENGQLCQHMP